MLPFRLVFHPSFTVDLGLHVFPRTSTAWFESGSWRRAPRTTATSSPRGRRPTRTSCACTRARVRAQGQDRRPDLRRSARPSRCPGRPRWWRRRGWPRARPSRRLRRSAHRRVRGRALGRLPPRCSPTTARAFCLIHDVAIATRRCARRARSAGSPSWTWTCTTGTAPRRSSPATGTRSRLAHQEQQPPAREAAQPARHRPARRDDGPAVPGCALALALPPARSKDRPSCSWYPAGADPYEHDLLERSRAHPGRGRASATGRCSRPRAGAESRWR